MRQDPPRSETEGSNLPAIEVEGHKVLDLDGYIPFLIGAIGNKWSRSSSGLYLREFGVGVTEWRVIAMLAIEPRITAYRICQVIGLDKAAASRALKGLEERGLVKSWQEDPQNHRKLVELTEAGWALQDRILVVARRREALMLSDLSRVEVTVLAELLRRLHKRIPDLLALDGRDL